MFTHNGSIITNSKKKTLHVRFVIGEKIMHIAYVVDNIGHIAGGTRVIVEHLNGLAERGHTVELWVCNKSGSPYFKCNATIKDYDPSKLSIPDVVVITDQIFIPGTARYRSDKRTFLLMQHDSEWIAEATGSPSYAHFIDENKGLFFGNNWDIIVVSTWLKNVVTEKYGIESKLVPNGVDSTLFYPTKPIIDVQQPTLLLYYDPQRWKGFMDAATAALEVKKQYNDLIILIIGTFFPEYEKTESVSTRFSFPAIYFNVPAQTDLARIYASATVFVSASWREGFGLPGLEALACGTPIATTDSGGIREYAIENETAIIVPPQNTRKLIDGILRVLDDKALRNKLSKSGLKKAMTLDWKSSIQELEKIMVTVIE
jgi:glycosyltransferase involved in cell wall biosynthesis